MTLTFRGAGTRTQTMLVGQTAINFAANVFSAAFGLLNVMVFTRLFAPAEFGSFIRSEITRWTADAKAA